MIISTGRDGKWAGSDVILRWREQKDEKWLRQEKVVTDFKKCWALNNLQPLWRRDNMSKGDSWDGLVNA